MAPPAAVRFAIVDAFAEAPFKGNPAAVCLLPAEDHRRDAAWMHSVASELSLPMTAFVSPVSVNNGSASGGAGGPRFGLRWFCPGGGEVYLCGHATLAAAHFLFSSGHVVNADAIEFVIQSGTLIAKKKRLVHSSTPSGNSTENFAVELDFPVVPVIAPFSDGDNNNPIPLLPITLSGASVLGVLRTSDDIIIELSSGQEVCDLLPNFTEIHKCPGRGVIVTGPGPAGSGFDFCTRFFCPKYGLNEDHVCGSAHCALAPYWAKKLGKQTLTAFTASSRTGVLHLQLNEENQRVHITGQAVTVVVGTLLA